MDHEVIELELTPHERVLLLRYIYPFEGIRKALDACQASKAIEVAPISAFELERLIGDLSSSINDMTSGAVQNQLLDLCDRLEAPQRYGDGRLDWI